MTSKIDKKGDHEPTQYFIEPELTNIEKIVERRLGMPEELNESDIKNLCSKFLMNKIYYKMAKKKRREQALKIAAGVIFAQGRKIKNQIDENDLELGSKNQNQKNGALAQSATEMPSQPQNEAVQKGGKSDIPKISGGTLSEVISKLTEMLAGKSGSARESGIDNFSAMFEVLDSPEIGQKFDEVMQYLSKDLILVADIKDILAGSKGEKIFDKAIAKNFSDDQKLNLAKVFGEVSTRREENAREIRANNSNAISHP